MIYVVSINLREKNHVTEKKKTLENIVIVYTRFITSDYANNIYNKECVR